MRLALIAFAALLFFGVLWGPALWLAYRAWKRGDATAFRQLRYLLPAQLMAAVALAFAADLLGMRNPAALFVAATLIVSLCGAALLALLLRYFSR